MTALIISAPARLRRTQVGPIMRARDLWSMVNTATTPSGCTYRRGPNLPEQGIVGCLLSYTDSAGDHQAQVHLMRGEPPLCQYCRRTNKPVAWCSHIRTLISDPLNPGIDRTADLIGDMIGDMESVSVGAPIIPSEGVFIPVHLYRVGSEAVRVDVEIESELGNRETVFTIGIGPLGQLGFSDIRSMFVDWMYSKLNDDEFVMDSPLPDAHRHEYAKDVVERNSKVSKFSNAFYSTVYGASLGALEKAAARDGDVPKL